MAILDSSLFEIVYCEFVFTKTCFYGYFIFSLVWAGLQLCGELNYSSFGINIT